METSRGAIAFHRTGGQKPPLLLAHGLTDNGLCWTRSAAALAERFDVIMLDGRGHGETSMLPPGMPDDPAADFAEVLEALDLTKPVVMGHSLGARAAALFVNRHPQLVSRVVLEDPPFTPSPGRMTERRQAAFRKQMTAFRSMPEEEIIEHGQKLHPNWHPDEFPAWAAAKKQVDPDILAHYDFPRWQETIDKISVPTLLIHGDAEHGGIVTPEIAREAEAINSWITSVKISNAGHNIRRENFDDYIRCVVDFLDAVA